MAKKKHEIDENGRILLRPVPGSYLAKLSEKNLEILGGGIVEEDLYTAMDSSYYEYVGNRVVGRDLPLGMDGLNYSMRRILYGCRKLNLLPDRKMTKMNDLISATMKLHPHGPQSIHKTASRMGRPSDMMNPLLDCEGNFGSAYDKAPSADRYLSLRLSKFAYNCFFRESRVINDIYDKRMAPTFIEEEPVFLPTRYPYALLEWNQGICVGIASQLPAFNFGELLNVTIQMLHDPDVKAEIYPDTPTPVNITNKKDLKNCFDQAEFHVRMESQWKTVIEHDTDSKGKLYEKHFLIITSAPVSVTPETIMDNIEKIKREEMQKNLPIKKFDEILDVIADSSPNGIDFELMIEYRKGADPNALMEKIYKCTGARKTVAVQCNVIDDQTPRKMTPREIVRLWIDERITLLTDWVRQNYTYNKFEALKREAFIIIKPQMKVYVDFVQNSPHRDDALVQAVADKFGLSRPQADYILNQKFKNISKASITELQKEFDDFTAQAKYYKAHASVRAIKEIIEEQLKEGIKMFGRPRVSNMYNKKTKEDTVASNSRLLIYNRNVYYCMDSRDKSAMITDTLDQSFRTLVIDDADHYMAFSSDGTMKNIRGIDFATTVMPIENRIHNSIVRIIPVKAGKMVTLVTAMGICKSLDVKSIEKGAGTRVIKLADKDEIVDAVATKKKGALGVFVDDKMYYTDMTNIPDQKKGSAGNNIFKEIKTPSIKKAVFIPNDAEHLIIYCESGYFKVIANNLPGKNKANSYISTSQKAILGLIPQEGNESIRALLIRTGGTDDVLISLNDKMLSMTIDGTGKNVPVGTSIGSPVKVLKFTKTEFYDFI